MNRKRINLAEHFKEGNIIYSSYWQTHDKVLSFNQPAKVLDYSSWDVEVVQCDSSGNITAGCKPRFHCTDPNY